MINILCRNPYGLKKHKLTHLVRIMKLSIFLLFVFVCSGLAENAHSQNAKVTLNKQNVMVSEILNEIENQTEYLFLYNKKNVNVERKTSLNVTNESVAGILNRIFSNTNVSYEMEGKHIVLSKHDAPVSVASQEPGRTITGLIRDENGEPVIGANVMVAGTSIGTITDIDGNFSLQGVPDKSIIRVSYIGYLTQDVVLKKENSLQIVLREDTKKLDEVVVIAYGTAQRKSIVGAVDQIASGVIEDRPVGNLTQALQGASANLVIQQKSFNPNDNSVNINIRGISTMNNNDPLVVIDGLVVEQSSMNNLNPSDIENISVLKDAGSAAIYGSRSANGVILITTKKGRKDERPVIKFTGMVGTQNPHILFKPVKGYENAILRNQALVNGGSAPIYSPAQIQGFQQNGDSEWFLNEIMKNALQQNYNLNISGGSKNSTYMISGGYYDQESNFVGADYGVKRYNFRTNMSTEYQRLKLSTSMAYVRTDGTDHTTSSGTLIVDASRIPVYNTYSMKDANARYLVNDVLSEFNPLGILEAGGKTWKDEDNFTGSVNADLDIIDGLKLRGVFGGDLRSNHRLIMRKKVPFYASETATVPSGYANSNRETEDYNEKVLFLNSQLMLDFNRTFAKMHQITGLLGVSNESYTFKANELKKKYTDPDLGIPVSETEIITSSYNTPNRTTQRSLYSVFGRAGYSYNGKYYGEFSFRYDGSSKFAENNRWGFFPSVSGGWRVSEEAFMTNYRERFGELKLRGSYGILGNQNVDDYQYQTTYNITNNAYGFNNVSVAGTGFTFANKELKWELSKTFNVGVDATFFNNSVYASFDYFNKRTSDILITPEVPTVYGGAVPKYNAGEMQNQGWEITLSYRFNKGDFRHNVGLNLADSWNEVLAFDGNEQISSSDQMQRIIRVGLPFNSYYGYKTDGYFQNIDEVKNGAIPVGATVQPGDVRYVDRDNNGVIDDKDRFVLGNAFPRYTFGITYDMSWKNFDFNLLLQGVGKRSMFLRGELVEPFHSNYSYTMFTHQLDYWTPVNPDARWPRLAAPGTASNTNNYGKSSDLYLFNASYLRLKNIQIGYTLPKTISMKAGMQKLRGYVTAQNLLTLAKNGFIDPESTEFGSNMGNNGANSGRNYPTPIYVGFGLDIEF